MRKEGGGKMRGSESVVRPTLRHYTYLSPPERSFTRWGPCGDTGSKMAGTCGPLEGPLTELAARGIVINEVDSMITHDAYILKHVC